MPIVTVNVAAGREPDVLRDCLRAVHEAVRDSLGVADSQIRVLINEVPEEHWSSGGHTLAERKRSTT
jgi:4-oxalocrotonate tautomerase